MAVNQGSLKSIAHEFPEILYVLPREEKRKCMTKVKYCIALRCAAVVESVGLSPTVDCKIPFDTTAQEGAISFPTQLLSFSLSSTKTNFLLAFYFTAILTLFIMHIYLIFLLPS